MVLISCKKVYQNFNCTESRQKFADLDDATTICKDIMFYAISKADKMLIQFLDRLHGSNKFPHNVDHKS